MKKMLLTTFVVLALGSSYCYGEVTRSGNTFIQTSSKTIAKKEVKKTKFTWQDSKGVNYPIYISDSGSCFVIKVSKKTGKEYRQYLGKELSIQICKELGLTYKGK